MKTRLEGINSRTEDSKSATKKKMQKNTNMCWLNSTLLNNQWVNKENKEKMKKVLR